MNDSSQKKLAELSEEVNAFFRKGAHDIQNLFHVLYLWMNTEKASDKEQTLRLLQELKVHYTDKIDQLHRSFQDFQSISNYESATHQRSNVSEIIEAVINEREEVGGADQSVSLETRLHPEIVFLGSADHLKSAVRALLDNALRYRAPHRRLTIRISALQVAGQIEITVQDNGIGIDTEQYQGQLFQPFMRFTDQSDGQGLSLHLVKILAEKSGGGVSLVSQPDAGTTVTLRLGSKT